MERILLNSPFVLDFTVSEVVFWSYYTFSALAALLLVYTAYCFLRPKLPARVNCWFCNRNAFVPYLERECWTCQNCDQYNGFNKDGDYNTDIHKRMGIQSTPEDTKPKTARVNGLCESCNTNQQLKVEQLARFTPMNNAKYDEEIDHFRKRLDNSYRLCSKCEKVLTQTLQSQHYNLLANRMNDHRMLNDNNPAIATRQTALFHIKNRIGSVLKLISSVLLFSIMISSTVSVVQGVISIWLPPWFNITAQTLMTSLTWLSATSREISAFGAISYGLSYFLLSSKKGELSILIWLTMAAISWTDYAVCTLILSIFNVYFQRTSFRTPLVFLKKQELTAMTNNSFTPQFLSENTLPAQPLSNIIAKSLEKTVAAEKQPIVVQENVEEPKKVKKRIQAHKIQNQSNVKTRSQAAAEEEQVKLSEEKNKRSRLYSPPPEVYDGFRNLHLSCETPKKTENNSVPKKDWSGILKPAKFFANSTPTLDDNDSRSSTPSSQASIKPDRIFDSKPFPDYPYTKISPLYNKFSSPCSYGADYNDFNVVNNMHPNFYSNGFTPPTYQMYPGPIGHTTVYTYTRPSPFPYGFPSQRFSPPFEYSSPMSPRISEVGSSTHSVSGNTFLSQSSNSGAWSWIKRIFYAASIVFNIVSVSVLLASYWYGRIQISGN